METPIKDQDFEGDCKKGTKESQKRTTFEEGGTNTTGKIWHNLDSSKSINMALFKANSVLNQAQGRETLTYQILTTRRAVYCCEERTEDMTIFPLSNQSPDHTLEAVDKQQWFSPAGVWTVCDSNTLTPYRRGLRIPSNAWQRSVA
jgi:hypothetical protein